MVRRILINADANRIRIAITEDGKLAELFTETPESSSTVGNIYLGRVAKIQQGMNAAFVDIGLEQAAFLHFSDVDSTMEEDDDASDDDDVPTTAEVGSVDVALRTAKAVRSKRLPTFSTKRSGEITINLQPKQLVVVQVTRDAYASKGVRVSTKVGLPGRNVVLLPFEPSAGVSRRITNPRERRRLRSIARSILPEGMGCIIRTAAQGLDDVDVRSDFEFLVEQWNDIARQVETLKGPGLLYREPGITYSVVRDMLKEDVKQVLVDDRKVYREIKNYLTRTAPSLVGRVELYTDNRPLFDTFKIERDVHNAHARTVPLPSGGSIVIDHTEAMVVIDVNSGRASNERSQEGNAVKTNFEAVVEVARQLRLRDIGGMVVVDFIDMANEDNRKRLFNEMKRELQRDRAKTVVYPVTQMGLIQITRQRIRQAMAERSSEVCPMCFGTGNVQSAATTVTAIDRWLRNFRAGTWKLSVVVAANPFVVHHIQRNKGSTTWRWLRQYFLRVRLREDAELDAGEFRCYVASGVDVTRKYLT